MGVALVILSGAIALAAPPSAQAFLSPVTRYPFPQGTSDSIYGRNSAIFAVSEKLTAHAEGSLVCPHAGSSLRCSPAGTGGGLSARNRLLLYRRRPLTWVSAATSSAGEGGGAGGAAAGDAGADGATGAEGEGVSGAAAESARKPPEPAGASGAMEDELLAQLVGQDYGMLALLRNDKFKGLIVLLRNLPPDEWVAEVARTYPDDDEVKAMMGQVGKLMRMIDYYQKNQPKK
ncbi:unnamed protein product [Ectocarpus fasciculatus]